MKGCGSIDYTPKQVRQVIEHYGEMKSIAESISSYLDDKCKNKIVRCTGFENIICLLADLDESIPILTPRQYGIVTLVKKGYSYKAISYKLHISQSTVKFHLNEAVLRISTYLNCNCKYG